MSPPDTPTPDLPKGTLPLSEGATIVSQNVNSSVVVPQLEFSTPLEVPKRKKSVKFDPFTWFRTTKRKSSSLSTTSRKNSSGSSITSVRSRAGVLERSSSSSSSSTSSPMKFTRHHSAVSRRQTMDSIPEEIPEGLASGIMTAGQSFKWEHERTRSSISSTHIPLPQPHQATFQNDDGSPSGSSTSSDSFARASLCWEASVGAKRAPMVNEKSRSSTPLP